MSYAFSMTAAAVELIIVLRLIALVSLSVDLTVELERGQYAPSLHDASHEHCFLAIQVRFLKGFVLSTL